MIVLKFGGSSVRDAEWINRALAITQKQLSRSCVLISSAMAKTTDRLQEIAKLAENGEKEKSKKIYDTLKDFHIDVAKGFLTGKNLEGCLADLEVLFNELKSITKGLTLIRECSPRSNDAILAFGELFSTTIIAYRAKEIGIDAVFRDSRQMIKTDDQFTKANLIEDISYQLIREQITPEPGKLTVAQGFIGSTKDGITTTLGRGGSDYTAAIVGAALKAEEIQIWTDVDGIMSSDPRIIPKASTVPVITYKEAAELAYFGAKVIHPMTIQPATNLGIPVLVKNTGNPDGKDTTIVAELKSDAPGAMMPKAIAFKKGITAINITSFRMLLAYGFLRKIFEIFEKFKTSVDLIATSEVSVSMTIDDTQHLTEIENELRNIGHIHISGNMSIICIVGQGVWKNPDVISKVFSGISPTQIKMISLGSSDTNLSFVIPDTQAEDAIRNLHNTFFE